MSQDFAVGTDGIAIVASFMESGSSEQVAKLYEALGKAQGAFGEIHRSRTVTIKTASGVAYSFAYAPLEDLLAATRPALAANGLTVLTPIVRGEGDTMARVLTIVAHSGGGRMVTSFAFTPRPDMKEVAGQITYLRRYGYSAALNLAADDDDDDQSVQGSTQPATRPARAQKQEVAGAAREPSDPVISRESPLWQRYMEIRDEAKTVLPGELLKGLPIYTAPMTEAVVREGGKIIKEALDVAKVSGVIAHAG